MQLHYDQQIHSSVISILVYTENFSTTELQAFDEFGEPVVHFHKVYGTTTTFSVDFDLMINTQFRTTIYFDGTTDMVSAAAAAKQFVTDLETALATTMQNLVAEQNTVAQEITIEAEDVQIQYNTTTTTTTP